MGILFVILIVSVILITNIIRSKKKSTNNINKTQYGDMVGEKFVGCYSHILPLSKAPIGHKCGGLWKDNRSFGSKTLPKTSGSDNIKIG